MEAYYEDRAVRLYLGDCLDVLRALPDASVDAICTDPPYELAFMGRAWDASGIAYNVDVWAECLRVLKPGGHLVAFGGTRTYHRMASSIEDAGFEIRDSLHWLYGSGFPKSVDVSKAIDKAAGAERQVVGSKLGRPGYSLAENRTGGRQAYGEWTDAESECAVTAPATPDAARWSGWGTALKPSHEPLALMRWLVRLVTPPGGLILDPFCGTGTTLEAALVEGFHAVGIDADETACALARTRLDKPIEIGLFGVDP